MTWLTRQQMAVELRVSPPSVPMYAKRGILQEINLNPQSTKRANFRYRLRALPEPLPLESPIERVAFLTSAEVAAIVGLTQGGLRKAVFLKKLSGVVVDQHMYYTVAELRRFLAVRENRRGPGKKVYSELIVKWLRHYIAKREPSVQVLEGLLEAAVLVPEPGRSRIITLLWNHFDEVNALLKEAQGAGRGTEN